MLRYLYFRKHVTEFVYSILWKFPIGWLPAMPFPPGILLTLTNLLLDPPAPVTLNKCACIQTDDESGYADRLH